MRFLILSLLVLGCSAGLPSFLSDLPVSAGTQTVKSSIGSVSTNGLEGLNLVWSAPFNIDQYVVGFKVALTSLTKKGAKLPDSLFVKRTISTPSPLDGSATVDADFCVESKVFSAEGSWKSSNHDLELTASGNTDDQLTSVGVNTKTKIGDAKASFKANYNLLKKKLAGELKVDYSDTSAQISYDTEKEDPVIKLTQTIDAENSVSPSVSLKSLKQVVIAYSWTHKLPSGGSVETTVSPHDKIGVTWKDKGANGVWVTKLEMPMEDQSKTKLSLSRDFNY